MNESILMTSKYEQLVELLKTAIEKGDYPEGSKLASENELSRQYGISRGTVREALGFLTHQGYLSRSQGKGTFVANRQPQAPATDTYAIFIHAHGHVFEAQTRALVQEFQEQGAFPMVFDVEAFKTPEQLDRILEKVLTEGVTGLVIEEMSLLGKLVEIGKRIGKPLPLLGVLNFTSPGHEPSKTVVSDFYAGTQMGVHHLVRLGRRRIVFAIHRNLFAHPGETPEQMDGLYGEICRGYADAMTVAGLKPNFFIIENEFRAGTPDRDRMSALLKKADRPDAVFVFGDFLAKEVLAIADDAGVRVPEDLALMGYWNTPWAEMTRVPMTSVSICEDQVARLAAKKLLEARKSGDRTVETVTIKPRLVVRQSCGEALAVRGTKEG